MNEGPDPGANGEAAKSDVEAATSADQRWARRVPNRVGAQITHPRLAAPIMCILRDTSSTGAKLELSAVRGGNLSREGVPETFTLVIPGERIAVDCQVAWQQGQLVGVRYTSPSRRLEKQQQPNQLQPAKKHGLLKHILRR